MVCGSRKSEVLIYTIDENYTLLQYNKPDLFKGKYEFHSRGRSQIWVKNLHGHNLDSSHLTSKNWLIPCLILSNYKCPTRKSDLFFTEEKAELN